MSTRRGTRPALGPGRGEGPLARPRARGLERQRKVVAECHEIVPMLARIDTVNRDCSEPPVIVYERKRNG
jgi:hypothetical protein